MDWIYNSTAGQFECKAFDDYLIVAHPHSDRAILEDASFLTPSIHNPSSLLERIIVPPIKNGIDLSVLFTRRESGKEWTVHQAAFYDLDTNKIYPYALAWTSTKGGIEFDYRSRKTDLSKVKVYAEQFLTAQPLLKDQEVIKKALEALASFRN